MRTSWTFLLGGLLAASPAASQSQPSPERVRLQLNGTLDTSTFDYTLGVDFEQYLETASVQTLVAAEKGVGIDLGVQFRIVGNFGMNASYMSVDRDVTSTLTASVPHPLYFDQARETTLPLESIELRERAFLVGLGYVGDGVGWDFAVFAGVTFARVNVEYATSIDVDEAYPFDVLDITNVVTTEQSDSSVGFHAMGRIDYRFARHFGAGAHARYNQSSFTLMGASDDLKIDGLQVAAGLRLYF
jgi:hypothetical protein